VALSTRAWWSAVAYLGVAVLGSAVLGTAVLQAHAIHSTRPRWALPCSGPPCCTRKRHHSQH